MVAEGPLESYAGGWVVETFAKPMSRMQNNSYTLRNSEPGPRILASLALILTMAEKRKKKAEFCQWAKHTQLEGANIQDWTGGGLAGNPRALLHAGFLKGQNLFKNIFFCMQMTISTHEEPVSQALGSHGTFLSTPEPGLAGVSVPLLMRVMFCVVQ